MISYLLHKLNLYTRTEVDAAIIYTAKKAYEAGVKAAAPRHSPMGQAFVSDQRSNFTWQ